MARKPAKGGKKGPKEADSGKSDTGKADKADKAKRGGKGKDGPSPRRKRPPEERVPARRESPCREMRLFIVVGTKGDDSLDGAEKWARERAKTLGGTTHIWRGYSDGYPLARFRAADLTGGDVRLDPREYTRSNSDRLLPDFQNCRGRVTELMIFHHGGPVNEAALAQEIWRIFRTIRVPVCRITWWSCNAAVDLDLAQDHWTDDFMALMGSLVRCIPCGCAHPIELVWPTSGKCGINDPADATKPTAAKTGDGKVHRLRWGYRQADGTLGPRPDPGVTQVQPEPPDREPPYGQPVPPEGGTAMGVPVTKGTFD